MWRSFGQQVSGLLRSPDKTEPDYRDYFFTGLERGKYMAAVLAAGLWIAWFFYRDLRMSPLLIPAGFYYLVRKREALKKERQTQLALQFRDMILSVTAGIGTGQSIENAFLEAERDVGAIYGADSDMARELSRIRIGIRNNIPLEQQLLLFGRRSGVEEIEEFTGIFAIAKRSGGNLKDMIRRTAAITEDKIGIREEVRVLLSERKYEQKIMMLVPFGLMVYLQLTSPGFFDTLYHNFAGAAVMTFCLALYLAAIGLSDRIMDISV